MSTEDATRSPGDPEHARLRELLGAYALGHLERDDPSATAPVRAHLDGCTSCRADLAEITPLVALLDGVSPAAFGSPPFPPPELGDRIRDAVAGERPRQPTTIRPRRHRGGGSSRSRWLEVAAAAAVVVAVGAGAVVGRSSAPEAPAAAPVPLQPVTLRAVGDTGLEVRSAGVVAHTWGVELRMEGSGFAPGEVFHAAVLDTSGDREPAGEFLGTGEETMTCNLQSAVMWDDARAIVVMDEQGRTVLRAAL